MGHIAEPKGVDLQIQSPPLTDTERKEISALIKELKSRKKKSAPKKKEKDRA